MRRIADCFVAIDVETTGVTPGRDSIIQVGAVLFEGGRIVAELGSLVRPIVPVPLKIQRMTGIDQRAVESAPSFEAIAPELSRFLGDKPLVAHNADFDAAFVSDALDRCGAGPLSNRRYDTLDIARLVRPSLGSFRLERLAAAEGIPFARAHDAVEDAKTAGLVFLALFRRLCALDPSLLEQVASFARLSGWAVADVIEEALPESVAAAMIGAAQFSGGVVAARTDVETAARGEGRQRAPARQPCGAFSAIGPEFIRETLGEGGRLSAGMDSYEYRPQQMQVGFLVAEALSEGKHLIVEAGTGTGKSIAYLVPAAAFAAANRTRVLLSTHTINLQEQLFSKDIPLVRDRIGLEFEYALLKGRSNYLCLARWAALVRRAPALSAEELRLLARVAVWIRQTRTGDRAELGLVPEQEALWDMLASDPDSCRGRACPRMEACFFHRAREAAAQADILIVNHSLVFSDLASSSKILPEYQHIVFDEAHHLERVASEHLGRSASTADLERLLAIQGRNGLLDRAERAARKFSSAGGADNALREVAGLREAAGRARDDLAALLERIPALQRATGARGDEGEQFARAVRIGAVPRPAELAPLLEKAAALSVSLEDSAAAAARAWEFLSMLAGEGDDDADGAAEPDELAAEMKRASARLGATARVLGDACDPADDGLVRWVEVEGRDRPRAVFKIAPVHAGACLKEPLFDRMRSVIMTSATMTVGGSFDYFRHRLALDRQPPGRVLWEAVGSPFDYARQALLYVPSGLPNPRSGEDAFCRAIEPLLCELAQASGGRMLVLFTSHRMLRAVYHRVKPRLEQSGICVLAQGIDGSRSRLVEEFREDGDTVLFGSQSFWEGIDIAGPALSCVVLVKLPFSPPNQPLLEARAEMLAREGLDPFTHLFLPEAVLRFKQGFGRLIRTRTDRGVVAVLDRRVLPGESSYGGRFIDSLPGPCVASGDNDELIERLREWLPRDEVQRD